MKKISTLILFVGLSSFVFGQKGNSFSRSFNNNQVQSTEAAESGPGTDGGIGGADEPPAPIDDYIPVLAAAGVGMAVYFGRKKYLLTNK